MALTNLIKQLLNAQSRSVFILSLLLLALPTGYDVFVNPLLLVVLVNTLISAKGRDWLNALKNPVFWLPALFYTYYALTILWAQHPENAWTQLETKLTLLLAPLVLAANARFIKQANYSRLLSLFVLGNVLTLVYALGFAINRALVNGSAYYVAPDGASKTSYFTYTMLSEPVMHVGYFSTYIGVALLICAFFLWQKVGHRSVWAATGLFLLIGFFLLQGRINILALFAVMGVTVLYLAISKRLYTLLAIPVAALVLFAVFVAFGPESITKRFTQLPDLDYDITAPASEFNSATYRLAEWKGATLVIQENPLFGTGVGDNRLALQDAYRTLGFKVGVDRHYNAHNQYLETAIAGGLIGLSLLLIMLAGYVVLAYRKRNYLLLVSLVFFAGCMLTESMLERAWAVIFYAVFFPIMLLASAQGATNKSA